jgi:hypothetical protein
VIAYISEKKNGNISKQTLRNLYLKAGAEWKLLCDDVITIEPSETRESMVACHESLVQIQKISNEVLEVVWQSVKDNPEEYKKYSEAYEEINTIKPESFRPESEVYILSKHLSDKILVAKLLQAQDSIIELSKNIFLEREKITMSFLKRKQQPIYLLYGISHNFETAINKEKLNYSYIKLY